MSKITFAVRYDESFRRGVSCPLPPTVTIEIDPAELSREERDLIATRLSSDGSVTTLPTECRSLHDATHDYGRGRFSQHIVAHEPTVSGVLAAIRSEDDAWAASCAKVRAAAAQEVDQYLSRPVSELVEVSYGHYAIRVAGQYGWVVRQHIGHYHQSEGYLNDEQKQRISARREAAQAEADKRNADIQAAHDAKEAAAAQTRLDWIAAHGSQRLQMMVVEGIDHAKTYQAERAKYESDSFAAALAESRPGWYPIEEHQIDRDIADVSLRTLSLLTAARAIDSAAKLARMRDGSKHVAVAEFRGRLIAWPRD